jgi:hypothetical protein
LAANRKTTLPSIPGSTSRRRSFRISAIELCVITRTGIFLAETLFGAGLVNSDGKQIPLRYVAEQHVREDLGRIPTAQDWLLQIKPQRWMFGQRLDDEKPTDAGGNP